MVDALTAAAAVLGALGSLVVGVVILDGQGRPAVRAAGTARRPGRRHRGDPRDLVSALIGRGWRSDKFRRADRADDPRGDDVKPPAWLAAPAMLANLPAATLAQRWAGHR